MSLYDFAAQQPLAAVILAGFALAAFVTGLVYAERIVRAVRGRDDP